MKATNITVVIRSSDERTEQACLAIVREQVGEEDIFVINEKPFSEAVRKNFQIGIDRGKKWTLAVDADVLLFEHSIAAMIAAAEKLTNDYFIYQGWVYDHFFREVRAGGPHLYRTSLLPKAITFIPEEGKSLRPESDTYHQMQEIGYYMYQDLVNFGIHDFQQSYFDIYRKFFLHAKKHHALVHAFLNGWKDQLTSTLDYIVAMRGLSDGLIFTGTVYVDTRFFEDKAATLFDQLQLTEKETEIDDKGLKELLLKHQASEKLTKMRINPTQHIIDTKPKQASSLSLMDRMARKTRYLTDRSLAKCAKLLMAIAYKLHSKE